MTCGKSFEKAQVACPGASLKAVDVDDHDRMAEMITEGATGILHPEHPVPVQVVPDIKPYFTRGLKRGTQTPLTNRRASESPHGTIGVQTHDK
jgi:hypothetical protein